METIIPGMRKQPCPTRASKSSWITPYLKKRMYDRDILKLKASRSKDANDNLNNVAT